METQGYTGNNTLNIILLVFGMAIGSTGYINEINEWMLALFRLLGIISFSLIIILNWKKIKGFGHRNKKK